MTAPKPLFTPEQIAEDGRNRLGRTMGQVTVPGAVVTVLDYALQRWANEPALPPAVVSALVVILTALAAYLTLRKRIGGEV